ncbi:MAG TPA: TetR/AcrR family transcriptional regulator [Candidatus Kapabacteria bacterium]|nr:TetR/AcrR family transcriptional regulator [Candidatus Kapabacteria bacterium]
MAIDPNGLNTSGLKKTPTQPRARRTVERIIAATAALIEEQGLDALTTNRVAERANVNIASLYQYFPNKQALLSALLQQYWQDLARVLNDLLDQLGDVTVDESTRLWAQLGIQHFRNQGGVLVELLRHPSQLAALPEGREFEHRLMEAMRRFLTRQRDRLNVPDLDRAIYVAFQACTAILSRHLLEPMPYYRDDEIVEELARLMRGYFY